MDRAVAEYYSEHDGPQSDDEGVTQPVSASEQPLCAGPSSGARRRSGGVAVWLGGVVVAVAAAAVWVERNRGCTE